MMEISLIIFLFVAGIRIMESLIGTGECALILPILSFIVWDINQLLIALGTTLVAMIPSFLEHMDTCGLEIFIRKQFLVRDWRRNWCYIWILSYFCF